MFIAHGMPKSLKAAAGRHVYSSASAPEERYVYSSDTLIVRAPEERYVYSSDTLIVRAPEERNVYSGWELNFLSPAGRHVYSAQDTEKS